MPPPSHTAIRLAARRIADHSGWCSEIIDALRIGGSIPAGARVLGVATSTLRGWIKQDPPMSADVGEMALRASGNPLMGPGYGNRKKKR
jgi:hypothetical protein